MASVDYNRIRERFPIFIELQHEKVARYKANEILPLGRACLSVSGAVSRSREASRYVSSMAHEQHLGRYLYYSAQLHIARIHLSFAQQEKDYKIPFTHLCLLLLYSWGAYLWKSIGTSLHIYTVFTTSRDDAIADCMRYSESSVVFFGIIRHIYNYIKLKQAAQQLRIEKQEAELNYLK